MKFKSILLMILLLVSVFLITSCGKKAECDSSSDCATGNPCIIGRCKEGQCVNTIKPDCCGNAKCEPGSGENKCTCSLDCGRCEGKVKYNVTTFRGLKEKEANYAQYTCINNICTIGVDASDISVLRLTNDVDERGGFKAEVLTTLNSPFDLSKDNATVRVQLKDVDPDVLSAITFTSIQVLSGSELMGEKLVSNKLNQVGDIFTESLNLVSSQSIVEEEKRIDIKLDFTYTVDERGEEVIERDDSKSRLSEEIIFVAP